MSLPHQYAGHVAKRIHYHSRNQADVDQVKAAQANGLDQIKADLQHLHDRLVQLLQDLQTADLKKIQEIQTQRTAESKEIVQTQARMEQLLKELLATGDEQASAWTRIEESQKRVEASVGALSESLSSATSLLNAQQNMQLEQKQVVQEVLDRVSMLPASVVLSTGLKLRFMMAAHEMKLKLTWIYVKKQHDANYRQRPCLIPCPGGLFVQLNRLAKTWSQSITFNSTVSHGEGSFVITHYNPVYS
eukprot:g14028.t1